MILFFFLFSFCTAKDGRKYVHTFTNNAVSPAFSNFLAGIPREEEDGGDWEVTEVAGSRVIYSENCKISARCRADTEGRGSFFKELGKVRLLQENT